MNAAALVMTSCDEGCLGRKGAGLGHLHAAATSGEKVLRVHDQSNLDHTVDFPRLVASQLITAGVDIFPDDLVIAEVVHEDGRNSVFLDDFHFLDSPSPLAARGYSTTGLPDRKSNFFFALQERSEHLRKIRGLLQ